MRFQLGNHLGSVALEVDKDGDIISYEEYFPYGGTALIAGRNQREVKVKEYRYSGKERDDSTGLYYYGARYYAPWLGRWISADPAGTVDGLNLYGFVGGNPVKFFDHRGLSKKKAKAESVLPEIPKQAFPTITDPIWPRGKKRKSLTAEEHFTLGKESFKKGQEQGRKKPRTENPVETVSRSGLIYLFRVDDKEKIPQQKDQTYTTPGNPWTPQRSVSWVKGGIHSGAKFVLTTDPTDPSSFKQDSGKRKGEPAIYAREVAELLSHGYIPILERRASLLKRQKKVQYAQDDHVIVLTPGREIDERVLKTDWSKVQDTDIPNFKGDFFSGINPKVTSEDIADPFQQFSEFWGEQFKFKLYGKPYGQS